MLTTHFCSQSQGLDACVDNAYDGLPSVSYILPVTIA